MDKTITNFWHMEAAFISGLAHWKPPYTSSDRNILNGHFFARSETINVELL
jgi:hypothetical protein